MAESLQNKKKRSREAVTRLSFKAMLALMLLLMGGGLLFLLNYQPAVNTPSVAMTLEQKMTQLQAGAPLAQTSAPLVIPRWLLGLVLGFAAFQMLALVVAAYRARSEKLTGRDLHQIEFLVETPMFLGLLGSLVGICMMQVLTGSLAAPIAYLTSITGIVLYIIGRFTILESLPTAEDLR